jgi:hypothetical protein
MWSKNEFHASPEGMIRIPCLFRASSFERNEKNAEKLGSFAYAEPTENAIQQIIGIHRADHGAKLVEGSPQFQGKQLRRVAMKGHGMGSAQMVQTDVDMVTATTKAGSQRRPSLLAGAVP